MGKLFKVVTTPRLDRFEENVTALLNDGWETTGPVFIAGTGGMALALVKEEKDTVKSKANVKSKV